MTSAGLGAATTFDVVAEVIRSRRTSLVVDRDRPVPDELVATLCELASWAPCHKRTWPWRFTAFSGAGRQRLGDAAADALAAAGADQAKIDKTRTKYLRAPTMLVVGAVHGDDPVRTAENHDATCAAVQNLLLGATAAGLASYWSSCPIGANDAVAQVSGFDRPVSIVAVIYLGWPARECPAPDRPPVELTYVRLP